MAGVLFACLLVTGCCPPQDPARDASGTAAQQPADPRLEKILARLGQFPAPEQEAIAERVHAAILGADHPLLRAAADLERTVQEGGIRVLDADPARAFEAAEYAPALKLRTRLLPPRSTWWRRLQRKLFRSGPPPPEGSTWRYEPGRDALVRPDARPAPAQRITAWLAGRWAEPARLQALAEARLDDTARLDAAADYFEHHYRDREGRVYSGIRLYDVWNTGQEFGISDVEAIAWLRLVAGERGPRSPIPARLHDDIYRRIRDSFAEYRSWRELRQALASRMVDPAGEPPSVYRGLRGDLDRAWALVGHDAARMRELLAGGGDRKTFFGRVAAAQRDADAATLQAALASRQSLPQALSAAALEAVAAEGLLGAGRRRPFGR